MPGSSNNIDFELYRSDLTTLLQSVSLMNNATAATNKVANLNTYVYTNTDPFIVNGFSMKFYNTQSTSRTLSDFKIRFIYS